MLDEGFQLALEHRGFGGRVVGYCERESYAASVLLARMEDASLEPAPVWCGDLAEFPAEAFRGLVDGVVGGIPCQPFSLAGEQRGTEDERWLWPAMRDVARRAGAWFVAIENVGGFVRAGLEPVLNDFAESGWSAEWLHLSAGAVGASHKRERIFLLGVADAVRNKRKPRTGRERVFNDGQELADSGGEGCEGGEWGDAHADEGTPARGSTGECRSIPLFAPGRGSGLWGDVIAHHPDLAPAVEPGLRVLVDGVAYVVDESRADQLRCAGNGVVALQAAAAFAVLLGRVGLCGGNEL